jgi:hypothetical protein
LLYKKTIRGSITLKTFSGRNPSQNPHELRRFIELLQDRNVSRYLEIGARDGDTFHEVMISLPVGSYGMAVDLPGGLWGRSTTVIALNRAAEDLRSRGYEIDVVLGDSTTRPIINRVKNSLPFHAALIDGDHRYQGVKADWMNYKKFTDLVAFHDIVGHGQAEKVHGNLVEVPKLWTELKAKQDTVIEFIAEGSLMGIGVCISPF